jgi:hypothetical protein
MLSRDYNEIDRVSECTTAEKSLDDNIVCPRCNTDSNFYICTIMDRQKVWNELHCFKCRTNGSKSGDFVKILKDDEMEKYLKDLKSFQKPEYDYKRVG